MMVLVFNRCACSNACRWSMSLGRFVGVRCRANVRRISKLSFSDRFGHSTWGSSTSKGK